MLSKYVVKPLEAMVTDRMNKTKICSPLLSVPSVSLFSFLPHLFFFHSSSTAATSTAHCLWFTRIRNITLVIRFYLACCFTEGRAFCDRKCLLYLRAGPFSNSDTFSFLFVFVNDNVLDNNVFLVLKTFIFFAEKWYVLYFLMLALRIGKVWIIDCVCHFDSLQEGSAEHKIILRTSKISLKITIVMLVGIPVRWIFHYCSDRRKKTQKAILYSVPYFWSLE